MQAGMNKLGGAGNVSGLMGKFFYYLTYVLCALLFCVVGACAGYVSGAGIATILGALLGLVTGLLLALVISGDLGRMFNAGQETIMSVTEPMVPSFAREAAFGHDYFTLLVTVHHVRTVTDDIYSFKASKFDGYVMITCGDNPVKTTCVNPQCDFEETFKLSIRPRDQHIVFVLKDQEVLFDETVGACAISIAEVVDKGFPVMKTYPLLQEKHHTKVGSLMLSFDWGDDFPQDRLLALQEAHPSEFARREQLIKQSLQASQDMKTQAFAYGTFTEQSQVFKQGP
jgi:hypothetical protein